MPDPQIQPEQNDVPQRTPAIHTMKSDIAELIKEQKPSLANIVGLEVRQNAARQALARRSRPLIAGIVLLAAAIAGGIGIWLFLLGGQDNGTVVTPPQPAEPAPLFATESEQTVDADLADRRAFVRLMESISREEGRTGTIRRVKVRIAEEAGERFAVLTDFLDLYRITPPANTLRYIEPPLMAFFYYQEDGSRFGVAARTRDANRTLRDLLVWEASLATDFFPFFFDNPVDSVPGAQFENRTYRNIDWRFLRLSEEKDIGIGYAIFPARETVIISTSKKATETAIDRLFGAR